MRTLVVLAAVAACAPALAGPCAIVVDRQEFTRRTESIFAGLRRQGTDAVRWHIVSNRRLPRGDVEITTGLVGAIAPRLVVIHFSAFDPQPNATDNEQFGRFFWGVEASLDHPNYVVYSRVPLTEKGMEAEISRHSGMPTAEFAQRLSFVRVLDGNEDKAVAGVLAEVNKLDLQSVCAPG